MGLGDGGSGLRASWAGAGWEGGGGGGASLGGGQVRARQRPSRAGLRGSLAGQEAGTKDGSTDCKQTLVLSDTPDSLAQPASPAGLFLSWPACHGNWYCCHRASLCIACAAW